MKYIAIFALLGVMFLPSRTEQYYIKKCMSHGWKREYCSVKMTPKGPSIGINASA